ncbi:hypothetical protein FB382_004150 [Nocardioides ginsengisegetis]|uniref:Uncharacterized protein n=1 Tax=Nocardioides ginsengisegetis TaxID=661491 RepID=A0A7W3J431_9ACTN|nr:hypothetical protein [Nocardioides ginsengisegetis]MBA8805805.1 hypothetical protein [Nocardioides ginsengisegetis]
MVTPRGIVRRRAAVLATAALTASVLVACGDRTVADDAVLSGLATVDGEQASFVLPVGTLTVTVGDPVDTVAGSDARDAQNHAAPGGSELLPVETALDLQGQPWGGQLATAPVEATLVLHVGDQTRDLPSPYRTDGRAIAMQPDHMAYVAVPDGTDPTDVSVSVTYDGRDQTATPGQDPTGPAAALADLPTQRPAAPACGEGWSVRPAASAEVSCDLSYAGRTPYWPGKGWAAEGATWLVVGVERLEVTGLTSGGDAWEVDTASTPEGRADAAGLEHVGYGPTSVGGVLVLATASPTVDLAVAFRATRSGGRDPEEVVVSRRVRVG